MSNRRRWIAMSCIKRCLGNRDFAAKMLEKFARQLPQMIEELALAIGEMPNGEEGRGGPTALRLVHTLKRRR